MNPRNKKTESLQSLLDRADSSLLKELILKWCLDEPQLQQNCLKFLRSRTDLTTDEEGDANTEEAFTIWGEVESDLSELDEFGGGDEDTEDYVAQQLYDLEKKLCETTLPRRDRRDLLEEVIPYIQSGNAGMDDPLYDVAYATCKDDEDLRYFAQRLEEHGKNWELTHAMRIYREIGDGEKYLALRTNRLEYGMDYHDLATYFRDQGNDEQAIAEVDTGLKQGKGRMNELRDLAAHYAEKSGNRQRVLDLRYTQTIDRMNLQSYEEFKNFCTKEEWRQYEPQIVKALRNSSDLVRLRIYMQRQDYENAVEALKEMNYPRMSWDEGGIMEIVERLEPLYPEEVLTYYSLGLGNQPWTRTRKDYAHDAEAVKRIRNVLLNRLKQSERWKSFARSLKSANRNRPAFQQELAAKILDWHSI